MRGVLVECAFCQFKWASLASLYYPDTLVNLDIFLGIRIFLRVWVSESQRLEMAGIFSAHVGHQDDENIDSLTQFFINSSIGINAKW